MLNEDIIFKRRIFQMVGTLNINLLEILYLDKMFR